MRSGESFDYSTLNWVKGEIDETLDQARQALEAYVENPEDETQMRFCITYLHQVHGTLKMVELYGAAMLAEEMEQVAQALMEKSLAQKDDAYEVLMRAILQLPDYLERLQMGKKDMPMVLLPLLNDLRAARGHSLLSENALFAPDLSVVAPEVADSKAAPSVDVDIAMLARKLRPLYQMGLVGWYRERDVDKSLRKLATVIKDLRSSVKHERAARLFWITEGVIEALIQGGLTANVSLKLLLGQVDRQIKQLIENGEEALATSEPIELIKNLLYYVANAEPRGDRVKEIKRAFRLEEILPSDVEVQEAQKSLSGVNVEVMETVASAVKEELTRIKDEVDLFVRGEERDIAKLQPLGEALKKVADTLGMLGLGIQRTVVLEQAAIINDMLEKKIEPSDSVLLETARAFLFVESALDGMGGGGAGGEEEQGNEVLQGLKRLQGEGAQEEEHPTGERSLPEGEYRELLRTVIGEAKTDMSRVKDAIVSFITAPWEHELLVDVPQLNRQVKGSLSMLGIERAAELLGACNDFVVTELVEKKSIPDQTMLDTLADAITSIEYYLEALEENRSDRESILDVAEKSVAKLGYPVGGDLSEPVEHGTWGLETSPAKDQEATVEAPAEAPVSAPEPASVLAHLRSALDVWVRDAANQEALAGVTRWLNDPALQASEPTSREKVAKILSDMDSMVQLIAKGEGELNEEVRSTLQWALDTLSELTVGEAEPAPQAPPAQAGKSTSAVEEIEIVAPEEIAGEPAQEEPVSAEPKGEPRAESSGPEAARDAAPSAGSTPASAESGPSAAEDLDDEILEIFFEEADEELANINEHFPKWKHDPDDQDALTTVRRSFHTLKGSGRMVGATAIGEFAWGFENMLNRVIDHTIQASPAMFDLLDRALAALPELIGQFKGGPVPQVDVEALIQQAEDFARGSLHAPTEEEREEQAEQEAAEPEATVEAPEESATETWTVPAEEEPVQTAPGIDPVLLDIFSKESRRHLDAVREYLEQCDLRGEHCRITDDLVRAIHTLHGSAHMAGISDIAEICNLVEKYIKLLHANGSEVTDETRGVLQETSDAIAGMVSVLGAEGGSLPNKESMLERISNLHERELDAGQSAQEQARASAQAGSQAASTSQPADLDNELLEIFLEEGTEILDASEVTLQNWIRDQENKELVTQLQREIHTLKGGARMADAKEMGDLSHSLETLVIAVVEGRVSVSKDLFDLMQTAHDRLLVMLERLRENAGIDPAEDLIAEIEAVMSGRSLETDVADRAQPEAEQEIASEPAEVSPEPAEAPAMEPPPEIEAEGTGVEETDATVTELYPEAPETERRAAPRIQHEQVRVRADLLDGLVNFAGEVSIYRSRIEQQVGAFKYNLTEMEQTVARLREQLRRFEIETEAQIMYRFEQSGETPVEDFDPLELDRFSHMQQLSRALVESVSDLVSIQSLLENQTRETETLLLQQSRVNTELQEGLMRTRMVPFSVQLPRMRRLVRQVRGELGKEVELRVRGAEGELDRTVLDRVMPPLEHMLRNAIDHGIEAPDVRRAAGKPEGGNIAIDVSREGTEIVLRVQDDGSGIDLDAVRNKAIERGLLKPESDLTDKEVLQFIVESGFSTAEKVTQISGRGVGMDVVHSEIKQLGGSLQIDTQMGNGSTFIVRLPLTLSVNKALLVHVGEEIYAVPLSSIEGVVRVTHEELERYYAALEPRHEYAGRSYRFMHLGTVLGTCQPMPPGPGGKLPVMLVRAGDHRVALQVEGLMGSREIVVKSVGPQISTVRGISGATILGDGRVALILDVGSLVLMDVAQHGVVMEETVVHEEALVEERPPTVMVVDDSITVRKVTSRLLERNNMHVVTAKDGVDAVAVLHEQTPDLFLLDIEMPRMDGYELATHIRNDDRLKSIPIVMITSRTGQKHRQRAEDIGVNRYLGKPYQESELLATIEELLDERC